MDSDDGYSVRTDSQVSSLVDRHVASANAHAHPHSSSLSSYHFEDRPSSPSTGDPDALFVALEAEDDTAFRAARAQQLATELSKLKAAHNNPRSGDGSHAGADTYITLNSDDEVLRFTTGSQRCVLHFLHPDFARCGVMDAHLRALSQRHAGYGAGRTGKAQDEEVKFGRVDVRSAGFVVEKLGVQVLPAVVGFVGGVAKGRIVGFEGVMGWGGGGGGGGGREDAAAVTREIEKVAVGWGVLHRRLMVVGEGLNGDGSSDEDEEGAQAGNQGRRGIRRGKKQTPRVDDDDDDDWD